MSATTAEPGVAAEEETEDLAAVLPVSSFKEAAPYLRRPFTPEALNWKVQVAWDGGALIVCYIDRGLVIDRLNLVLPHLWEPESFTELSNNSMRCRLIVDGITREDVGEGSTWKARYSDSLKRVAVHFGVGVSLSRVPKSRIKPPLITTKKLDNGKWTGDITQAGLDYLRGRYKAWLDQTGIETFGKPLGHGDTGDAQGDEDDNAGPLADLDTKLELYRRLTNNTTLRVQRGLLSAAGVAGLAMEPRPQDIEAAVTALTEAEAENLTKLLDKAAEGVADG